MSRSMISLAAVTLAALSILLMIGLLTTGGAAARAPTSPPDSRAITAPLAFTASSPYCYSWDFLNNSGQDANDLHFRLKSIQSISAVYTGTLNPFGSPDPSSGYNPLTDTYRLDFGNGIAFNGDTVRAGLCTDRSLLRLGSGQPAVYWTVTGTQALPNPLFAGLGFTWAAPNRAQVTLFNEQSLTLTLWSFQVLDPDVALSLDDLNDDVTALLPLVADEVTDPQTLAPNGNQMFDIVLPRANHPYVFEAVVSTEDDPGNLLHVLAQTTAPPFVMYLPLIRK